MLGSVGLRPLDLSSMFACLCNSQSTESQRNLAWKDSQCPRGPSIKTVSHRAFVGPICIDCGQWAAPKIKSSRNLVQNDHCLSDNSGVSGRVNRQTQFPQFPSKIFAQFPEGLSVLRWCQHKDQCLENADKFARCSKTSVMCCKSLDEYPGAKQTYGNGWLKAFNSKVRKDGGTDMWTRKVLRRV